MDELDRAQQELEQQLESALGNRNQERAAQAAVPSADECVQCGELIPSARQVAVPGCQCCVHCAEKLERVKSLNHA